MINQNHQFLVFFSTFVYILLCHTFISYLKHLFIQSNQKINITYKHLNYIINKKMAE